MNFHVTNILNCKKEIIFAKEKPSFYKSLRANLRLTEMMIFKTIDTVGFWNRYHFSFLRLFKYDALLNFHCFSVNYYLKEAVNRNVKFQSQSIQSILELSALVGRYQLWCHVFVNIWSYLSEKNYVSFVHKIRMLQSSSSHKGNNSVIGKDGRADGCNYCSAETHVISYYLSCILSVVMVTDCFIPVLEVFFSVV